MLNFVSNRSGKKPPQEFTGAGIGKPLLTKFTQEIILNLRCSYPGPQIIGAVKTAVHVTKPIDFLMHKPSHCLQAFLVNFISFRNSPRGKHLILVRKLSQ